MSRAMIVVIVFLALLAQPVDALSKEGCKIAPTRWRRFSFS